MYVNAKAELVTLAPGLRPERRFAPLARGLPIYIFKRYPCTANTRIQRKEVAILVEMILWRIAYDNYSIIRVLSSIHIRG